MAGGAEGAECLGDADRAAGLFVRALLAPMRVDVAVDRAPMGVVRAFGDARGLHLPAAFPMYGSGSALARNARFAAAAHLAAHLRFGGPRLARGSLRPIQIVLVSLFEDARVERLAARELPGLARMWATLHTATPTDLATFPALCARISRALLVPVSSYDDPHPIVAKARALFFHPDHRLDSTEGSRRAGSLLGNDIGQMRLAFNAKTYVVEPPYRDDHRLIWEEPPPGDSASPLENAEILERVAPRAAPAEARATAPAGRARAAPLVTVAAPNDDDRARGAVTFPEWDYRVRVSRPRWCTVVEQPTDVSPVLRLEAEETVSANGGERDAALLARVRRLARQLRVEARVQQRRERDGDALDLDAAVAAVVDRRAGGRLEPRVYARTARRRRISPCWSCSTCRPRLATPRHSAPPAGRGRQAIA